MNGRDPMTARRVQRRAVATAIVACGFLAAPPIVLAIETARKLT